MSNIFIPGGAISKGYGDVKILVEPIFEEVMVITSDNTWGNQFYSTFIASAVFNITVVGFSGEFSLDNQVTIGFLVEASGYNKSDLCLGFILEPEYEWVCETSASLVWLNDTYVLAKTPHFTGFGMILNPNNNPSQSAADSLGLPTWAFVVIIVPVVLVVVLLFVIYYYRFKYSIKNRNKVHRAPKKPLPDIEMTPV